MSEKVHNQGKSSSESEIDLLVLAKAVWIRRKQIFKGVALGFVIGLLIAFLSAPEYVASTTFLPQTSDGKNSLGGYSGLAAMAGINVNQGSGNGTFEPVLYPQILQSKQFLLGLMEEEVYFPKEDTTCSFYNYFTEIKQPSPMANLKRYTLGLPGVIMSLFSKDRSEDILVEEQEGVALKISQQEWEVCTILAGLLSADFDDKTRCITLSATMSDAESAASLAVLCAEKLQEEVIQQRIANAQEELSFLEKLYAEKKEEVNIKRHNLARFRDENKNIISARVKTEEEQLGNEYTLSFAVCTEIAKELEQAKLKVKKDTPIFVTVEPVFVPLDKVKPNKKKVVLLWSFLGGFLGIVFVLLMYFLPNFKQAWEQAGDGIDG